MTFRAAYVITPVFSATEVIVILFCRVAAKTCIGDRLRVHLFERSDLRLIAACIDMFFSRAVTRFASNDLSFPGIDRVKLAVLGALKDLELCFVTRRACFGADVIVVGRDRRRRWLSVTACMLRYRSKCQPHNQ
jgi:hypothetical protein